MAVGLIKKQIIHSGGGGVTTSPPRSPLKGKKKDALKAAQSKLKREMTAFKEQKYINPYESAENLMAGMKNVYEDLTVNQQQAQFEKTMAQQQQSNIMQGMAGAAGGSGVAGLAQAMAGQGQMQAQRAAASIGQQEQRMQMAAAGGAERVQAAERGGAMQVQQMRMGGEQMLQQMEMDRQATLLGVAQAEVQGAQQAIAANQQMWGSIVGGVVGAAGSIVGGGLVGGVIGAACFAEGDEVEMFNGTLKAIELIKVGDEVKSIKNNKVVKGIVTNSLIHPINDIVEVVKTNGITAEPNHPVLVDSEWVAAKTLSKVSHEFINNWYNLEIDGNIKDSEHNYIIGGLTVSGLGDNIKLNKKYQRQPKQLTQHLEV